LFVLGGILLSFFTACNFSSGANKNNKTETNKKDTLRITVLQTADIHGQLDSHPELFWENEEIRIKERGGLAHIQTLFEKEQAKNPGRTIIVDGGDLIQGSGYSALSEGAVFSEAIKAMDYDLLVPGNWEVVYGKKRMLEILNGFGTPVIAQNMFHEKTGEALFPPFWIKEIDGVKLGFIGINDPDVPVRQNPVFSKGIAFSGIEDGVKELITKVKNEKE